jgi:hypothetical protein
MNSSISELVSSMDTTSWMVILSAAAIMAFILFAKAVKAVLKIAVIAGMLVVIAFFLRRAGIL